MQITIAYRRTSWNNTVLANFAHFSVHTGFALCCIRWWEQKFQGAKVPRSDSSTPGTFAPGSEWSWEQKVHNSACMYDCTTVRKHDNACSKCLLLQAFKNVLVVGRLGSGPRLASRTGSVPRLVGRTGSVVWVSDSFHILCYAVIRAVR